MTFLAFLLFDSIAKRSFGVNLGCSFRYFPSFCCLYKLVQVQKNFLQVYWWIRTGSPVDSYRLYYKNELARCFLVYTGLILPALYLLVYLSRNAIMFPSFAMRKRGTSWRSAIRIAQRNRFILFSGSRGDLWNPSRRPQIRPALPR